MIKSTLTRKWQTTIPVEVQKALGLKPRHRLAYELIDGGVLVRIEHDGLEDLYGCLANERPVAPKTDERKTVREARVARYR